MFSFQAFSQELIQVCQEPLTAAECSFSAEVPNYNDSLFDYLIYRDTMVWQAPILGKSPNSSSMDAKVDLLLDVYVPCNADSTRPVVIFPRANGYSSPNSKTKLFEETKDRYFLSELAQKGFVVVRYEWRTYTSIESPGFYNDITPSSPNSNTLDSCAYVSFIEGGSTNTNKYYRCHACLINSNQIEEAEILRNVFEYNLKQDALSAVGYVYSDPKSIGINADIDNIFIGGMSNGAQVALTGAYLDQDDMSNLSYSSQIVNYYGSLFENGFAESLSADFKFKGVFSLWGSCNTLDWIDSTDPTTFLLQGTWDPVIPYQTDYFSFAQYGDSSKFKVHGAEDISCKLLNENVNFGLISLRKTGHGLFFQKDMCTPDTVCGYVMADMVIEETTDFLSYMISNDPANSLVKAYNLQTLNCPEFIQNEYTIELNGIDSNGNCAIENTHAPNSLSSLQDYCDCHEIAQQNTIPAENLKSISENSIFNIFPNPTNDFIKIESNKEYELGKICNAYGSVVMTFQNLDKGKNVELDVSNLSKGVYAIRIENSSKLFIKID